MIRNLLTRRPPSGIYHLTSSGACTWYEFTKEILALAGLSHVSVSPARQEEISRPARRPRNSVLSCAKYITQGSPPPPHWKDGLIEYLKETQQVQADNAEALVKGERR
jgi:dTDP-4-dehydrorhamnose reductase